jgi:electron transfer flavoprotein beta subunit
MHIVVVMRLCPDLSEELELNEDGSDLDREWIGLKLNEFDDHALEEAVLLKENAGATVTAMAVAGEGVDRMLQSAIARGADVAVRIDTGDDEAVLDSRAATPILAAAIREAGADLVVTGVQTIEDAFGQLAPYLGAALGWSQVSAAGGIVPAGASVLVRQEYSGGEASVLEVALPAVIGLQTASQPPRYVSGSKLRQAMSSDALQGKPAGAEALGAGARITGLHAPERSGGAEMLDGDAEAIAGRIEAIVRERGLI